MNARNSSNKPGSDDSGITIKINGKTFVRHEFIRYESPFTAEVWNGSL